MLHLSFIYIRWGFGIQSKIGSDHFLVPFKMLDIFLIQRMLLSAFSLTSKLVCPILQSVLSNITNDNTSYSETEF